MKGKAIYRKPEPKTNFIGSFEPVVLTEIVDANRKSKRNPDNEYTVYETKDGSKVAIMKGEIEHCHVQYGNVLTDLAGKALAADTKPGTEFRVNQKMLVGRGEDGILYAVAD